MMNDRSIKDTFDQIHADSRLKEETKRFVTERMNRAPAGEHRRSPWRAVGAAAACLALVIILGGYHLYFTPTSVISVDINPSVELKINRFNKVIGVDGYNDDGRELAEKLDVLHDDYTQAFDTVMNSETITNCLAGDEVMSVSVVEISGRQSRDILQYVEQATEGRENVGCNLMRAEEASQAHEMGLSYGKYRVYQEIRACDPEITPDQVNGKTMRQLRDLLRELQGDAAAPEKTGGGDCIRQQNGAGRGNQDGYGKQKGCRKGKAGES